MIHFLKGNSTKWLPEFQWLEPPLSTLSPDNFTQVVNQWHGNKKHVLVVFHTPFKGFHPTWQAIQNYSIAMRNRYDVFVGEVDPDLYEDLAKAEGIDSFPTMKIYPVNGTKEGVRYRGQMTRKDMNKWVSEQIGTFYVHEKEMSNEKIANRENADEQSAGDRPATYQEDEIDLDVDGGLNRPRRQPKTKPQFQFNKTKEDSVGKGNQFDFDTVNGTINYDSRVEKEKEHKNNLKTRANKMKKKEKASDKAEAPMRRPQRSHRPSMSDTAQLTRSCDGRHERGLESGNPDRYHWRA